MQPGEFSSKAGKMVDFTTFITARSEMGSQLEEQSKPRFIRQLRNVTVTEGEDATLDCVLVAVPEPKVFLFMLSLNCFKKGLGS